MRIIFTTSQIINYLLNKPHKNVEFVNVEDNSIHVFLCKDGTIGQGAVGDGYVYDFDKDKFKNDKWILSFNPFKL
ncbi:hypothetical protein EJM73_08450 [Clostridium botulinum]|uniref:hypothetical protein n=1 Tax=Clostridium botulinum TaxID=1491 RepID=UPI001375D61F|nr:hypothetical protein [Clostridium botulinum]NCI19929.1 hypothetical protein [Clostridium botulinum]NCI35691.1 hypothetical protein [Clostridium botulinum]NCI71824.1 hypothetical protein [Clostridium botulinum]NDI38740.1 hypothetical protein [Clostridium botulinum]HCL4455080.1 hypothetical protein [Clostridium botulinum]